MSAEYTACISVAIIATFASALALRARLNRIDETNISKEKIDSHLAQAGEEDQKIDPAQIAQLFKNYSPDTTAGRDISEYLAKQTESNPLDIRQAMHEARNPKRKLFNRRAVTYCYQQPIDPAERREMVAKTVEKTITQKLSKQKLGPRSLLHIMDMGAKVNEYRRKG